MTDAPTAREPGIVVPTTNWQDRTAAAERRALERLLAAGDGMALLEFFWGACLPVPIGCWQPAAARNPSNPDLQAAALLEAAALGQALPAYPSPFFQALSELDSRDFNAWVSLLDASGHSRVLRGLLLELAGARLGHTWLTTVKPLSHTEFGAIRREPDQPVADMVRTEEPRQPWIEPRPACQEARVWQVPLHGGADMAVVFTDYSVSEDCALLTLPNAALVGHSGTVVWDQHQPSDLSNRLMDVAHNANYIFHAIDQILTFKNPDPHYQNVDVVVIHDIYLTSYYHSFIDYVPRLQAAEILIRDFGYRIAVPAEGSGVFRNLLIHLGFEDQILDVSPYPTRFRTVVVAAATQMGKYASPASVAWLRERFQLGAGLRGERRLLVSRADVPTRRITNEAALVDMLAPLGFERVVPGLMPMAEQLALFASAAVIVSPHGGALTNLIAAPPGTAVVEVVPSVELGGFFTNLSISCGLRHRLVMAAPVGVDMVVDPLDVLDALAELGVDIA